MNEEDKSVHPGAVATSGVASGSLPADAPTQALPSAVEVRKPHYVVFQALGVHHYGGAYTQPPEHMRFSASMVARLVPAKGKAPAHTEPGTSWIAHGATPEEAVAKLDAVWAKEHPPTEWRAENARKAQATRAAKAALAKADGRP